MTPKEELTLPSGAKTLLKVGALAAIVVNASRKQSDVPFSKQTNLQRLDHFGIGVCRGYLLGLAILGVLGIIGLIIEGLGGH